MTTNEFLTLACLESTDQDCPKRYAKAQSMLNQQARHIDQNIYTTSILAIPINKISTTARSVISGAKRGSTDDGSPTLPMLWRVISLLDDHNTQETAKVLLAGGADPDTNFTHPYGSIFTAVTGALGQGEGGPVNQSPHQYSFELAKLLLDAGANPNDSQASIIACLVKAAELSNYYLPMG